MRARDEGRRDRVRAQWGTVSATKIAEAEQTSPGAIYRLARELGLKTQPQRPKPLGGMHPAITEGRTKFRSRVISAKKSKRVLVPGKENQKLGHKVTKGRWKGLTIYSLTGHERASCPLSCAQWHTCYGNNLNWSQRVTLDHELRKRLDVELDMLAAKHPQGFLVRLHVLGDFGRNAADGIPYVTFWRDRMRDTPEIHVFGFTAHAPDSAVGGMIMLLNREFPNRWHVRFSGTTRADGYGATVIESLADSRFVVCPIETEHPKAPASCGDCGLCWTMKPPVEFEMH